MHDDSAELLSQSGSASCAALSLRSAVCIGGAYSSSYGAIGGGANGSGSPSRSLCQLKSGCEATGWAGVEGSEVLPKSFNQLRSSSEGCTSAGTLIGLADSGWSGTPPSLLSQSRSSSLAK